jgi:hypothetical protein
LPSLRVRTRKIEQITGPGVTTTGHIAEWRLALRAHDLLTGALAAQTGSRLPRP